MPTGYTADIKDGIDFKTFAMNCARAFGACVTLRDERGGGDKIPESFDPSDYHFKTAKEARDRLTALESMTAVELDRAASKDWDDAETRRLVILEEIRKQRASYLDMLKKVMKWKPPTPDHVELQTFMRKQIEQSIDFDCNENYYSTPSVRLTGDAWLEQQRDLYQKQLQYHEEEHAEEVNRAASRTAWVQALRESL